MRSRYTAFTMQDAAYLLTTWHSTTRPARLDFTLGQQWVLLRVIATATEADYATVEFIARSKIGGKLCDLHEVSRFVREGGRWYYVDGIVE